ncbi:hypothetical protein QQP08_014880 [Theobroma cacao]|nr:hypothetical protein QQP08_014880 [Theobroma cacao]
MNWSFGIFFFIIIKKANSSPPFGQLESDIASRARRRRFDKGSTASSPETSELMAVGALNAKT